MREIIYAEKEPGVWEPQGEVRLSEPRKSQRPEERKQEGIFAGGLMLALGWFFVLCFAAWLFKAQS